MFDNFISWDMLATFGSLSMVVFMVVEYTKSLPFINKIKTKYYAGIVAFVLIVLAMVQSGQFVPMDIVLYMLSAIAVTFTSSGISTFNDDKKINK